MLWTLDELDSFPPANDVLEDISPDANPEEIARAIDNFESQRERFVEFNARAILFLRKNNIRTPSRFRWIVFGKMSPRKGEIPLETRFRYPWDVRWSGQHFRARPMTKSATVFYIEGFGMRQLMDIAAWAGKWIDGKGSTDSPKQLCLVTPRE